MADTKTTLGIEIDSTEARVALEELASLASSLSDQIASAVDIKRLRFQPGDTIVVRTRRPVMPEMGTHIADHVRRALQVDDIKVLVLDDGMSIDVLSSEAA